MLAWLLALLLAVPAAVEAQPDLDEQVRAIAAELRCPVCQNLSVADSPSELAREMRGVIREQLAAGKTPEEVKAYFVAKYGDWVLLSPRPRGLSVLVWVAPFATALVGAAVALRAVRRWTRPRTRGGRPAADPALLERVRSEVASGADELAPVDPELLSPVELERNGLYAALRELELDYRAGKLSEADYHAMRDEYEARAAAVLAELGRGGARLATAPPGAEGARPTPRLHPAPAEHESSRHHGDGDPRLVPTRRHRRPWRLATAGAVLLVFGLSLGYFLATSLRPRLGEQDTLTGDFLTGTGPGAIMPGREDPARQIETLLQSGRAAFERQDSRAAIDAFKQALALDPENPEAHTFIALILFQAGHVDGALLVVDRALAKEARYPFALWMKGHLLSEGKQNHAAAIELWEQLMAQPLAEVDADRVAQALLAARQRLSRSGPPTLPVTADHPSITGKVSLAPSLRADVPPGAALFIIARQGDGPPLAVKRIARPTFPVAFSLGPADRMLRDRPFAGEVSLVARLKRDGAAGPPAPGDLEGRAASPVPVGQRAVEIVLDRAH